MSVFGQCNFLLGCIDNASLFYKWSNNCFAYSNVNSNHMEMIG
jgi:hypothetical protein